jgi:two-component system, cell cycle sensor histidine kinase and response regulator CckA
MDRFKHVFEAANVGKSMTLPTGEVDANQAFADFLGYTQEELKDKTWQDLTLDEDIEASEKAIGWLTAGEKNSVRFEKRYVHKNGDILWGDVSTALRRDKDGAPLYFVTTIVDITERKRTEAELRRSEGRLRFLTENMADIIWTSDLDLRINYASLSIEKVLGFTRAERTNQDLKEMLTPESRKMIGHLLSVEYQREKTEVTDPERSMTIEVEYYHKNGGTVWLENTVKWIRSPEGSITGILGVARDISDRKQAEKEKETLQSQLMQAQKMESVGRLAGGVAHDFNNKLTVILGYAQMAMEGLRKTDPIYANLQQVMKAGEQSVQIVSQLLAFARKQTIAPKVLDLNETVEGMLKMLRRLIGEDIDLAWEPDSHLWPVKMDPSQIDQILANLCVNARDAISGVGKVTIETENVVLDESYCADRAGFIPGEYVMMGVSDNGCGMDKETLANAFEPFFTTKEVGKGTGLGLATVYGIVKQNHGFVNIYSEPGHGTTFKIYLPRYSEEAEVKSKAVPTEVPRGRGETILVVEDDTPVLGLARRTLENLGYGVMTSANPVEAIAMAREHDGDIHLLLTDVVLPEMSGKDLAREITKIRPAIRTLYMSGYTANVIAHQGVLDEGVHFIGKPFTPESLARKVREALGSEK